MKFEQLGLKPNIQQALDKMGFEEPTPVQEQAIPFLFHVGRHRYYLP